MIVLLAPLILGALVFLELRRGLFHDCLLVDARTYHEMAASMAQGRFQPDGPFWQPPFYPLFLAGLYRLFGVVPDVARVAQIALHAASSAIVFLLGRRFLKGNGAWVAWAIAIAYGPMLLATQQLLSPVLATFLLLLALWFGTKENARSVDLALAGLFLGLASITVATMLVVIPLLGLWVARPAFLDQHSSEAKPRSGRWRAVVVFVVAAMIAPLCVTAWNAKVSGEPIVISYNGGINFWLGNNPRYDETTAIRPGRAWKALTLEPQIAGARSYAAQSAYFYRKALAWMASDPAGAFTLGARKLHLLIRGDEILRNEAVYPYRGDSLLLRVLLWSRGIGFPFGLLLPLALLGAVIAWKPDASDPFRRSIWMRLIALSSGIYLLAVAAYFVTGRYRLPVVPLLALLAAPGVQALVASARARRFDVPKRALGFALALFLVSNVGLPAMSSEWNSDAHHDLGYHYQSQGRLDDARAQYRRALELDPNNLEAANNLAGLLIEAGQGLEALPLYQRVLRDFPDDRGVKSNVGTLYFRMNEFYLAGNEYESLLRTEPRDAVAEQNLRLCDQAASRLEADWMGRDPQRFLDVMLASYRHDPANRYLLRRMRPLLRAAGRDAELSDLPAADSP